MFLSDVCHAEGIVCVLSVTSLAKGRSLQVSRASAGEKIRHDGRLSRPVLNHACDGSLYSPFLLFGTFCLFWHQCEPNWHKIVWQNAASHMDAH